MSNINATRFINIIIIRRPLKAISINVPLNLNRLVYFILSEISETGSQVFKYRLQYKQNERKRYHSRRIYIDELHVETTRY